MDGTCPADAAPRDDPGLLEHLEVLGNRLERHRKERGQLTDGCVAFRQPIDDRATNGIAECGEDDRRIDRSERLACDVQRSTIWLNDRTKKRQGLSRPRTS